MSVVANNSRAKICITTSGEKTTKTKAKPNDNIIDMVAQMYQLDLYDPGLVRYPDVAVWASTQIDGVP